MEFLKEGDRKRTSPSDGESESLHRSLIKKDHAFAKTESRH